MSEHAKRPQLPYIFPNYNQPPVQRAFEIGAQRDFAVEFPDDKLLMELALNQLHQVTAAPPAQPVRPEETPYDQETAQSEPVTSSGITGHSALICLMIPQKDSPAWVQQGGVLMPADGHTVVGEMPPQTRKMLEYLYELVGAKLIRQEGSIVTREGRYNGRPVYLQEIQQAIDPDLEGNSSFRVSLLSAEVMGRPQQQEERGQISPGLVGRFIRGTQQRPGGRGPGQPG